MIDLNEKLSPNFTLREFVISQVAERKGIINTPSNAVISNIKILCEKLLEPARVGNGPLRISSGYRCVALNNAVGGDDESKHLVGLAADIIPMKVSTMEFAVWVAKNLEFDQLILEYGTEGDPAWIHLGWALKNRRRQIFRKLAGKPYTSIIL